MILVKFHLDTYGGFCTYPSEMDFYNDMESFMFNCFESHTYDELRRNASGAYFEDTKGFDNFDEYFDSVWMPDYFNVGAYFYQRGFCVHITDDDWEYFDDLDEMLECFEVIEITEEEYVVFTKYFPYASGVWPF
jgi:glyoxylate utilization-related uncharacterized protein